MGASWRNEEEMRENATHAAVNNALRFYDNQCTEQFIIFDTGSFSYIV